MANTKPTTTAGTNVGRVQRELHNDNMLVHMGGSQYMLANDLIAQRDLLNQDLALQNSRIRRLYELLDQLSNRCRYSLQIRADDDNRREDIVWIRDQIDDQTFTIGRGSAGADSEAIAALKKVVAAYETDWDADNYDDQMEAAIATAREIASR